MEEQYALLALYICLIVVQLLALCSFNVSRMFLGFTIDFVISAIIFFSSLVNCPTYGCPTKVLANSWLWIPQINFTIQPFPPCTSFPRSLKEQPHFLLPMSLQTNSFFLHLYWPLLSQAINTKEVLPLLPVCVLDLVMIATNSFSRATDRAHNKTSSRVPKTYNTTLTY